VEEEKAIPRVRREVRKSGAITLFRDTGKK
jgi:hypothetical protein